jgi:hypothetical protein
LGRRVKTPWMIASRDKAWILTRSGDRNRTRLRHVIVVAHCCSALKAVRRAGQAAAKCPSSRASTAGCATSCRTRRSSLCSPRRVSFSAWKDDYNTIKPHSALGNLPPAVYAKTSDPGMQRKRALRHVEDFRRVPLHHRANRAQMKPGLSRSADEIRAQHTPPAGVCTPLDRFWTLNNGTFHRSRAR